MKKLGVIGGMGSEATSYFFNEIVKHTVAVKDQEHIDTIIFNLASIPDRTEAILTNKNENELLSKLINNVNKLEELGVGNIAIPCNTSHYYYDVIQSNTKIPIINMVEETIKHAMKNNSAVKKIGIMATSGTIKSNIYHEICKKYSVDLICPSEKKQEDIMSLIYDEIKSGKPGELEKFSGAYNELMDMGCQVIILACTELSVFYKANNLYNQKYNCLDAMDVLVKEAIDRSGACYKNII